MLILTVVLVSIVGYSIGKGIKSSTTNKETWIASVFSWFAMSVLKLKQSEAEKSWWGPRSITVNQPPLAKGFLGKIAEYTAGDIYSLGAFLMHIPFFFLTMRILMEDYTLVNSLGIVIIGIVVFKVFESIMTHFAFKRGFHWTLRLVVTLGLIGALVWGGNIFVEKFKDNGGFLNSAKEQQKIAEEKTAILQDSIEASVTKIKELDKVIDKIEVLPLTKSDSFWIDVLREIVPDKDTLIKIK